MNNQPSLGVPFVWEVMRAPKSRQPGSDPGLGIESQMQSLFSREIGTAPVAVIKQILKTGSAGQPYKLYIWMYMYVHMYVYLFMYLFVYLVN